MTDLLVERLRIACQAEHGREREALALRTRLERIARGQLPAILDREILAFGEAAFGLVGVRLDFDPADYDDATVAVLWADRIRRAASGSSPLPPGAAATAEAGGAPGSPHAASTSLPASVLLAVVERALMGDGSALDELTAILDSGRGRDELERLPTVEHRALAEQLERHARRLEAAVSPSPARPAPRKGEDGADWAPGPPRARERDSRLRRATERAKALREVARALRRRDEPGSGPPEPRRPAGSGEPAGLLSSSVAGIFLLYPWLGRFLTAAADAQPGVDPVAVRRLALARLVPDAAGAAGDPLVRFLAGDDLELEEAALAPLPGTEDVDVRADAVLRRFAQALPGFESSSPEFLRREFLLREGTLAADTKPAELVVGALPLDPVLVQLPYPIGLVRLPWAPSLSVRIER